MKEAILWHYTVGDYLPRIVASGAIRPADFLIDQGERPAVWFSQSDRWEEVANKQIQSGSSIRSLSRDETHQRGGGLARIGVPPSAAPHDWTAYLKLSGVRRTTARSLERAARRVGSRVEDWRVSFLPVYRYEWVAAERWSGERWVRCSILAGTVSNLPVEAA